MEVKITQCSVGRFSLGSNEKELSFYMGIYDGKQLLKHNGFNATIHYTGEPEELSEFEDALNDMANIIDKSLRYCGRVWSTRNYWGEALAFVALYNQHYEEIHASMRETKLAELHRQKSQLNEEIESIEQGTTVIHRIDDTTDAVIMDKIKGYIKIAELKQRELDDLKEGTATYEKCKSELDNYKSRIESLTPYLSTSTHPIS